MKRIQELYEELMTTARAISLNDFIIADFDKLSLRKQTLPITLKIMRLLMVFTYGIEKHSVSWQYIKTQIEDSFQLI